MGQSFIQIHRCRCPLGHSDCLVLVPDQADVQATPRANYDSKFVLFKSYQEFFDNYIRSSSLNSALTLGATPLQGAFSRTKAAIQELLANNTRAASTINNFNGLFQVSVFPNLMPEELDPGFARAVGSLPTTYDSTAYGYGCALVLVAFSVFLTNCRLPPLLV